MKHLKTIVLSVVALIVSTEMCYSIIFTGPARRNAHRQQAEEAYAAGEAAGATGEVTTQSINPNDDEVTDSEVDAALDDAGLLDDYQAVEAPSVKIQAMEVTPMLTMAPSPAPAAPVQPTPAQAIAPATFDAPSAPHTEPATPAPVTPAVTSAPVAPAVIATAALLPPAPAPVTPAIVAPTITPATATPIIPAPAPVISTATPVTPTATPVASAVPAPATHETTGVVKVYPVIDAIKSAAGHVYSAAQDMMSYAYNLVSSAIESYKKESAEQAAKAAEAQAQKNTAADEHKSEHEKGDVKIQNYRGSQPHADW